MKVGKQFDPECIECHVVGFGRDGGFHSEAASPQLLEVGCEACHGPGKKHIAAGGEHLQEFTVKNCIMCHNDERSPAFNAGEAWINIRH